MVDSLSIDGSSARLRFVSRLFVAICLIVALSSCESVGDEMPNQSVVTTSSVVSAVDSELTFKDPSVPDAGGTGLPDSGRDVEEVDCEEAETICDAGDWACDDIADYCDYGPDDGSELSDDWDWDN